MADNMDNCDGGQYDPFAETMPQDNSQNSQSGGDNFTERSRSRSPIRKRSRSRSVSPRDWKPRSDRNDRSRDKGNRDRDRRSGGGGGNQKRLYISNIPYELRWQDLKDLFRDKVGEVTYVELYESADGKPCGSGIIEFKDKETATKAIDVMHKYEIKGRKVVVREERESDRRRHARQLNQNSDMDGGMGGGGMGGGGGGGMRGGMGGGMGGNMGGSMGGGGMNMNTGIPGISPQMLNQLGIEGPVTSQIFIANLDYKVTAKKIRDIFKMAGNIQNAELKEDKDGKSRGMAIVQFEHPIEAVQAISMFNGQILFERAMSVRMDKMADQNQPAAAPRLPSGLKTIGMGLGSNGLPLSNISQLSQSLLQLNSMCGGGGGMGGGNMGGGGMGGGGMGGGNMGGGNMGGGMGGGNMGSGMASSNMGNMGGMGGMSNMSPNMGGNMSGGMGSGMAGGMGGGMGFGGDMLGSGGMGSQMGMNSNMGSGMGGGMSSGMAGGMGNMGGQNTGMGGMAGGMRGGMDTMGLGGMSSNSGMDSFGMGNNQMGGMAGGMGLMGMGGQNTGMGPNTMMRNSGNNSGKSRNIDMDNSTVFVRNLPFTYTWQNLKEKFRHIGEVKYAAIRMENNRSKGCGVVRFISQEEARRAISMMNGARIEGREIEVRMDQRN